MLLEEIAEELVNATSDIIGGRAVHIMNPQGIIIASSQKSRIGNYHEGAMQAIRLRRTITITKSQEEDFPGSRQGIDIPIIQNGRILGALGIYGEPDEIMDLAHLLEVYVKKCLEAEAAVSRKVEESDIRNRLFYSLTSGSPIKYTYIYSLMDELQLELRFPLQPLIISSSESVLPMDSLRLLMDAGYIDTSHDFYIDSHSHLVVFKSSVDQQNRHYWKDWYKTLNEYSRHRITTGTVCASYEDIALSYREIKVLHRTNHKDIISIDDPRSRCYYILEQTSVNQSSYLQVLSGRLSRNTRPDEKTTLLNSAEVYYEEGHSLEKAAQKLFIHKNTLQYRLKKLYAALDIMQAEEFEQELLVLLLIRYEKKIHADEEVQEREH